MHTYYAAARRPATFKSVEKAGWHSSMLNRQHFLALVVFSGGVVFGSHLIFGSAPNDDMSVPGAYPPPTLAQIALFIAWVIGVALWGVVELTVYKRRCVLT